MLTEALAKFLLSTSLAVIVFVICTAAFPSVKFKVGFSIVDSTGGLFTGVILICLVKILLFMLPSFTIKLTVLVAVDGTGLCFYTLQTLRQFDSWLHWKFRLTSLPL